MSRDAEDPVVAALQQGGAIGPAESVLALLSGGADSVCLVHGLAAVLGRARVHALYVHHGLRAGADADERFCGELCAALGVTLHVERVQVGPGNVEAAARAARYGAAETVRAREGLDVVATGHTSTDQVETILY